MQVEADCFGCLSKFLDGIQDHYTFAQPGIQQLVFRFKELVRRIDGTSSVQQPLCKFLGVGMKVHQLQSSLYVIYVKTYVNSLYVMLECRYLPKQWAQSRATYVLVCNN